MAIKPTYEELEQRIKEVESRLEQREETLRLSVERNKLTPSAANENGNAVRLIGTDTDITDRKQVEEALRKSRESSSYDAVPVR
jgi:hypothetical protein